MGVPRPCRGCSELPETHYAGAARRAGSPLVRWPSAVAEDQGRVASDGGVPSGFFEVTHPQRKQHSCVAGVGSGSWPSAFPLSQV